MKIKYEPVFGDQSLFDEAPTDCLLVTSQFTQKVYLNDNLLRDCRNFTVGASPDGFTKIAMRRIIKTPTWTKADQLAGKLPEVGSMILFINNMKQVEFAGTDGGDCLWYFKRDSGAFGSAYFNCFKPIETTEEKARRERREWGEKASAVFINSSSNQFTSIYDALLSGELEMPNAGE